MKREMKLAVFFYVQKGHRQCRDPWKKGILASYNDEMQGFILQDICKRIEDKILWKQNFH